MRNIMKIILDTEVLTKKAKVFWERWDAEHVLMGTVIVILVSYIALEKLSFKKQEQNSCCVDVVLEKPSKPEIKKPIKENVKFSQLYNTNRPINISKKQLDCLSKNIYWEAMREPLIGQISVAHVTYNRVLSRKWGDTFCDVIFEPKQFSWTNNENLRKAEPKNKKQWKRAKHSAMLFAKGVRVTTLFDSEFYYAKYIKPPKWSKKMKREANIGQHIFLSNKTNLANSEKFE